MRSLTAAKWLLTGLLLVAYQSQAQSKKWTLEECVDYAIKNNISIKQSELDLKTVAVEKLEAIGGFLPTLNANANYSINTGANINPATNQFENETFKSLSAGANSSIPLFNGLQNWRALQRVKLSEIANNYRLDKMKDDIALSVANGYLQILFNKEQLKVLQNQNTISKQNIERTKQLIEAGSLPAGDIYELQATDASQEQQIINTQNALLISKISLCQLLLLEEYASFDIADEAYDVPLSAILNESQENIVAKAKEAVKDVKIAMANLDLAKKDVSLARSSYLPTLSAFLGYNTRWSESVDIKFIDQLYLFDGTAFGLQLNVPILNGFATRGRVQRSKINKEKTELQLKQAELDLERNVYQAYNDVSNAQKSYEAAQKTLEARKQAFDFSKARYEIGLMNSFDYSQATVALENAQSEVLRTKYDYIFRTKILEFYFGIPLYKKQ
ncbi:TolC family protein [Flavobacterium suncheonense]|uniref:Transporter n=1 Tax=Flavobacterium suncheonense GH29-5 = DSM 17707 TaxID=1121899 RepID=A0A0A2MEG2_9FLAO|nr:TolC family protein [Flavobacterium suncheonense]KGO89843.1 transporter [Flavobacterium suncheonense GH29-5 = DSM 17707]